MGYIAPTGSVLSTLSKMNNVIIYGSLVGAMEVKLLKLAKGLGIPYRIVVTKLSQVDKYRELLVGADEVVYKNGYNYSHEIPGYQKLIVDSCDTLVLSNRDPKALGYAHNNNKKIEEVIEYAPWRPLSNRIHKINVEYATLLGGKPQYDSFGYVKGVSKGRDLLRGRIHIASLKEAIRNVLPDTFLIEFVKKHGYKALSKGAPEYAHVVWETLKSVVME